MCIHEAACVTCYLRSVISGRSSRAERFYVHTELQVHREWELICHRRGKHMVKWSTNENGKLLPLVGPVQVHVGGGGGRVMMDAPCPRCCWYDQKNTRTNPPPLSLIYHHNRQTDVCRWLPGPENCLCAKLPLEWEILFICCSPIMIQVWVD